MGRVVIPGFRKIETSGGGGGGTSNYNDLTNKPSINNVPLVGNLNTVNLKLTDSTLTEEGVPAEAKTVGAKLEEHSTSLLTLKEQLGNHTVKSDVPENAVFTDTKDWESITGKPDSFPPSSHGHTISEITGLQDTLDGKASSNHTHDDRYYTETEVDAKLNKKAESIHNHTKSQITDFPTSMPANGGNADTVNSHTVKSDVPENAVFTDTVYDDTEVKKEIDEINSNLSVLGKCKNLLNPTFKTTTSDGVTCTNNGDGTYTLNGTATGENAVFEVDINRCIEYGKTYRIVGCPQSGGNGKYGLETTDRTIYGVNDFGDGAIFNPYETGYEYKMLIVVYKNYTVNNLVFKPMLTTNLNATYDDFVPYTGDGETLTYDVAEVKNDLDKLNALPIGTIIQIDAKKDTIATTEAKYSWQYLGTSNIQYENGGAYILETNVYRKNN